MLQHLISFVENDRLESREVDIASLDMIKHSTTGANEEVHTLTQLSGLVLHTDSTIDRQAFELSVAMLEFGQLILDL